MSDEKNHPLQKREPHANGAENSSSVPSLRQNKSGSIHAAQYNESDSNSLPSSGEMTLFEHLRELRKRLIIVFLIIVIGAFGTYNFSEALFYFFNKPYFDYFPKDSLIGTGPAEAFILKIKMAVISSLFITSPLIFFQAWKFIEPGLYEGEKKLAIPFVLVTTLLFLFGCFLCYITILPITLSFFREQYTSIGVTPQIKISEHLSLSLKAILGFGLIFEVPVLAYFLGRFGLITHKMLLKGFRYAIVAIFILAAILTPTPDVITQCLFALPLLLLYGISIIIVRYTGKQRE
jgi:sec-independent protein translocase protein TatC